jgi:hypothetical protein
MLSLGRGCVLVVLLCGCGKAPKPNERAPGALGSASAEASREGAAPARAASVPSADSVPRDKAPADLDCSKTTASEAARQLLNDWNAALNAHDVSKLEKLYALHVFFYGRNISREQVAAAKRTALAASPGFKQQLSDVRIAPDRQGASITFNKASGASKPVHGRLGVACADGGAYAIATESDAPSDALARGSEDCEAAMYAVAFSLPAVKKEMASATDAAPFGGVSYPTEGKHHSVALGFHHQDRFEAAFFLDWNNGVFTVDQGDQVVPAAGQARVRAACPK